MVYHLCICGLLLTEIYLCCIYFNLVFGLVFHEMWNWNFMRTRQTIHEAVFWMLFLKITAYPSVILLFTINILFRFQANFIVFVFTGTCLLPERTLLSSITWAVNAQVGIKIWVVIQGTALHTLNCSHILHPHGYQIHADMSRKRICHLGVLLFICLCHIEF